MAIMMPPNTQQAFRAGEVIQTTDGASYRIGRLLGAGGQGQVYHVTGSDGEYALKWYHADRYLNRIDARAFYENLAANVEAGKPRLSTGEIADQFIWPMKLTKHAKNSFGYIMELHKPGYNKYSEVVEGYRWVNDKKVRVAFSSWFSMITAALNIVRGFELLHAKGLSYQDLNEGGFFIEPKNGDVMICDCDNVSPNHKNLGIRGCMPYMAPEVVRGERMPDSNTDLYSLAIILFRLFYHNHPMDGQESKEFPYQPHLFKDPCYKKTNHPFELRKYGTHPHYSLCPNGPNPPCPHLHKDVLRFFPVFPKVLLKAFERVFINGVADRNARLTDTEWRNVLMEVRDSLVLVNGIEQFFYTPATKALPENARVLHYQQGNRQVLCMPGKILYDYHAQIYSADYKTQIGKIIEVPGRKDMLALYNATNTSIRYQLPDGSMHACEPKMRMPLMSGEKMIFGNAKITVE